MKKYSREEYDLMFIVQYQQLYVLQFEAEILKGKKTPDSNKVLEARVAVLGVKTDNSSDEHLFADKKPKANKRNNPALDRKGDGTGKNQTDS